MGGKAHFVHVDLVTGVVGRRIGLVCDHVGATDLGGLVCDLVVAIDLGGLAMVGGIDQPLFDGHLSQDFVPWPIQGWHGASLVVALDHVALWPSATSEPPLPGVRSAEMRLLEELLLLMPW